MLAGRNAAAGTRLVVYPASMRASASDLRGRDRNTRRGRRCRMRILYRTDGCAGEGEGILSTQNRNFEGRIGDNNSDLLVVGRDCRGERDSRRDL